MVLDNILHPNRVARLAISEGNFYDVQKKQEVPEEGEGEEDVSPVTLTEVLGAIRDAVFDKLELDHIGQRMVRRTVQRVFMDTVFELAYLCKLGQCSAETSSTLHIFLEDIASGSLDPYKKKGYSYAGALANLNNRGGPKGREVADDADVALRKMFMQESMRVLNSSSMMPPVNEFGFEYVTTPPGAPISGSVGIDDLLWSRIGKRRHSLQNLLSHLS